MSAVSAPAPRSTRKPKGEGHVRRAEILAAAERIFVEHGYDGATIRKIADEVGLSSTALYMHFADKSEILYEICRNTFTTLKAGQDELAVRPEPFRQRLRMMLDAYVDFGFQNPNAYRLVYMTRPGEAANGAHAASMEVGRDLLRSFQSFMEIGAAEGQLKAAPEVATQVMWAGVHGLVSLMITKTYLEWTPRDVLADTMLESLLDGLVRA